MLQSTQKMCVIHHHVSEPRQQTRKLSRGIFVRIKKEQGTTVRR